MDESRFRDILREELKEQRDHFEGELQQHREHVGSDLKAQRDHFERALADQRKDIFRYLGDAVGSDLGDPKEVIEVRKDFNLLRRTRLRSERFSAAGEKMVFLVVWGSLLSAFATGGWMLIKSKVLDSGG